MVPGAAWPLLRTLCVESASLALNPAVPESGQRRGLRASFSSLRKCPSNHLPGAARRPVCPQKVAAARPCPPYGHYCGQRPLGRGDDPLGMELTAEAHGSFHHGPWSLLVCEGAEAPGGPGWPNTTGDWAASCLAGQGLQMREPEPVSSGPWYSEAAGLATAPGPRIPASHHNGPCVRKGVSSLAEWQGAGASQTARTGPWLPLACACTRKGRLALPGLPRVHRGQVPQPSRCQGAHRRP